MRILSSFLILLFASQAEIALASDVMRESGKMTGAYDVLPDVTYMIANGEELKLDIYTPHVLYDENNSLLRTPVTTVVYIHGGGWVGGDKDEDTLHFLPYLQKGWAVVNVEYRLARTSLAPAAVEDVRCAIWWTKANANRYGFDADRIILTGRSAGGHLALIAGILPTKAGLDHRCPRQASPNSPRGKVDASDLDIAAIVNWAGITDVNDLLEGENAKTYAVAWLGAQTDSAEIAKRVSPLSYIREGLPAVMTIHGDRDEVVPYSHAERLHTALTKASVPNRLHTIAGKHHFFDFSSDDLADAFSAIEEFLDEQLGTQ